MVTKYYLMAVWNDETPQLIDTFTDKLKAESVRSKCEDDDYFHDYYIVERKEETNDA